ncbi:MAG: protein kinase, partial [Longimicrobiales bacterium]|nr:protein kinase [Longimicrobiales bacterium]
MIDRVSAALEGRYRIERRVGEGGMAVVFLAHDERHDRPVAVKVLRPELAAVLGTERFLAEIRTTAGLQHPHILPLFDSGEAEGFLYYVMPYVEGESLRDRLERERQLPVTEAVAIASQLADGLDYAHRQGIVHRDLKPGNVLLLDGKPVLADFGIALAVEAVGGERVTRTGLSPGTPTYMSPEQAAGEAGVGPPADIYALGCVLYEMLAGRPPYTGTTATAVLSRIVTGAPTPVTEERPAVPANVDAAIARALEKVPADRFQSAAELRRALSDPTFRHGDIGAAAATGWAGGAGWIVAAVLALVLAGTWLLEDDAGQESPLRYGSVILPEGTAIPEVVTRSVDLSPDGGRVAFVVQEGAERWLHVRDLSSRSAERLAGPGSGVGSVAFSPDGSWIAFHDVPAARIRKVPAEGGVVETIAPTDPEGRVVPVQGLTWGPDGTVVLSADDRLMRVPPTGTPEPLTTVESGAVVHYQPEFLPDGTGVVFTIRGTAFPFRQQVAVLRFGSEPVILTDGHSPRVTRDGLLVVARGGQTSDLWVARLDEDFTAMVGEPVPVFEEIGSRGGRGAFFDVAADGTLAFLPAATWAADALVWVDRQGVPDTILTVASPQLPRDLRNIAAPRLSPGGERVVFRSSGGTPSFRLFTYDLRRTVVSSIPLDVNADWPVWTPDGDEVVFNRFDETGHDLYTARVDGAGRARPFQPRNRHQQHPLDFAPDGRLLAQHREYTRSPDSDIVLLAPGGEAEPEVLVDGPGLEIHGALSPDGRWLAYVSDLSGQRQVYVTDFPSAATRTKVSTGSAEGPAWSPDGTELFFRSRDDGAVMAVAVTADSLFRAGIPSALFVG